MLKKELKQIKDAIKDFQSNKEYAEREEQKIRDKYTEQLSEYNPDEWWNRTVIDALNQRMNRDIQNLWDVFGNDTTIHIIYEDGSECIADGIEITSGEIKPKMQHIAYAWYGDGYVQFDTETGELHYDVSEDDQFETYEEYKNQIEIKYGTEWGRKQANK